MRRYLHLIKSFSPGGGLCTLEFFSHSVRVTSSLVGFLQSVVQLVLAEDAVPLVLGEASEVQLGAESLGGVEVQGRFLTLLLPCLCRGRSRGKV